MGNCIALAGTLLIVAIIVIVSIANNKPKGEPYNDSDANQDKRVAVATQISQSTGEDTYIYPDGLFTTKWLPMKGTEPPINI